MRTATLAFLGTITAGTLLFAAVTGPGSQAAVGDDPATAPIPTYDYDDPAKAFVVDLQVDATGASLVRALVVKQRPHSTLGDPAMIRLALRDEDGGAAGHVDTWDPRWHFEETATGGERMRVRPARGSFSVPFDPDAGSLVVRDLQADRELLTVDLGPAVHDFCVANPADPDCVEADLAVTASTATGTPLGVVGESSPVAVSATVENLGPDGPVDAEVAQTATPGPGVTVTPASQALGADALAVGSPRTLATSYSVGCTAPGSHAVTFTTTIAPEQAKVVDAVSANNDRTTTYTVDCAIPVTVNAVPGSRRNPVATNDGAVPVAVLTTRAGEYGNPLAFDARTISAATVRIGVRPAIVASGTGSPEVHSKVHLEDVYELDERTRDGDRDGLLHGAANLVPLALTTTEVCVRGRTGSGTSFFGCDHVVVVP